MTVIPITDGASESSGRLVAEVTVNAQGRAQVRGATDDPTFARLVQDVLAMSTGLDKIRFRTPTGSIVRGWEGYWGTAFALRLVLPSVGLAVDWGRIDGASGTVVVSDFQPADAPSDGTDDEPIEWLSEDNDNATTV